MTLTLDVTAELEHQILREARRKGLDAKGFVLGLLRDYLASEASSSAQRSESELLEEINRGFPAEHWKRYGALMAKRRGETLTAAEHAEMLAMIQIREEANVHRVECLAELAKRRHRAPAREQPRRPLRAAEPQSPRRLTASTRTDHRLRRRSGCRP